MAQQSTVLILDDDPGILTLQRRALERAGYAVIAAASEQQALEQMRQQLPDLLLLDYRLNTAATGLDFYYRLRSAGIDLPAIMVTGFNDEARILEALRAGVRDVVPKGGEYLDYLPHAAARVLSQVRAERDALETDALRKQQEQLRALNADLERRTAELTASEAELKAAKISAEQAKHVAEEASRAKDHFLAVLSHELRTPLTPVVAALSMLQGRPGLDAEMRDSLEMIARNVELEARLIDDLLDVTRITRGKIELHRRPIPLHQVIHRAIEVVQDDIRARRLNFAVHMPDASYMVDADAARLQQVFWNLLRNSIKFTPPGGCVGVRCQADGDGRAVVEVSDSGQGIEPDALSRIFNAFEQAERTILRQFGGLGLGLTISKALVELHGGAIVAHSDGKGKGSVFRVFLPVVAAARRAEKSPAPPANSIRPLRILLVEDHADTARMMRRLLMLDGHSVELAGDVATALDLAGRHPFDLLISDLGLPDRSGLDLMRDLRTRGLTMPGIAISGYGQEEDIRRSRAAGFAAHLTKPTGPDKLAETIATVATRGAG